jgi:hypothetical protein
MGILPKKMRFKHLIFATVVCIGASLSLAGVLPAYHCPFETFFGFSCPMCGTTRAWEQFIHGDIKNAFIYNPLFLVWGFWVFVCLADLIQRGISRTMPTIGERCLQSVARNKLLRATHIVCFAFMVFYVNVIGPTAKTHISLFSIGHMVCLSK